MLPNSYIPGRSELHQEQQKLKALTHQGTGSYTAAGGSFLVIDDLSVSSSTTQYSTHRATLPLSPSTPNSPRRISPTLSSSAILSSSCYGARYQQSTPTAETLVRQASLTPIPNAGNTTRHPVQSSSNTNDNLQYHPLYHHSPAPRPSPTSTTTDKQKCTRCKRWRTLDQFQNDDPTLLPHAGCLECRESARKYGQSEYGKATRRMYNQTEKAKETRKKYAQSEKGRESRKKYAQTDKAKEVRRKYNRSEKAKETRKRRALMQSERQQEQGGEKMMDTNGTFGFVPAFMGNLSFDHSQESNDDMKSMEKAFWQTLSKTIYDRSKEQSNEPNNLEMDIRLKYRQTK